MTWRIEFAAEAERDFGLIFDHLYASYLEFGEGRDEAAGHAAQRVEDILNEAERIADAPHRGATHDDLLPGLRHLTLGRAIFWFTLDEADRCVRILAIFFGGQDHQRHMLVRLLQKPEESPP
ncbi:MAG: type II toxin-antitoxin system RelE/ParE family toxin [Paracoccaceae bacterium]